MDIAKVGVIGAGTMGHGIAQVSAMAGCDVVLQDLQDDVVQRGLDHIRANLDKGVARGKVDAAAAEAALARISGTTELGLVADDADLLVEAIPEKLALKQQLFAQLQDLAPAHAIFGTNTSSLSIAGIAGVLRDPGRVIGMHFFNPVHIMKLLELIVHDGTRDAVLAAAMAYGDAIGKTCITVRDFPGFATSRLGVVLGNEAIRMLADGVATASDIDTAMRLGYKHPMGPLELSDLVGLDVRRDILNNLAEAFDDERYLPHSMLDRLVEAGELGKKTSKGIYDWSEDGKSEREDL